jgi:hypothetical protein
MLVVVIASYRFVVNKMKSANKYLRYPINVRVMVMQVKGQCVCYFVSTANGITKYKPTLIVF